MKVKSIKLTNFLSFGPDSPEIPLGNLNVLIGPNGSGKSNLIEAFQVLRAVPRNFQQPFRKGGGSAGYIYRYRDDVATIDLLLDVCVEGEFLRYKLGIQRSGTETIVAREGLERDSDLLQMMTQKRTQPIFESSGKILTMTERHEDFSQEVEYDLENDKTALDQLRDPKEFREMTSTANFLERIELHREWHFGPYSPFRRVQPADLPNDYILPDSSNLSLVVSRIQSDRALHQRFLTLLKEIYKGVEGFRIAVKGGSLEFFVEETNLPIPAARLSDGTLRYLSLLAVLCDPEPGSLICIEEPELGLHPDLLPGVARLLVEASERTQIIVTTHSDVIIDTLTSTPEVVLVCEKGEEGTIIRRLVREELEPWLERYRLGEYWASGGIGGNRW